MRLPKPLLIGIAGLASLALAGCAAESPAPAESAEDPLVAAARAEGQVVMYSSAVGTIDQSVADAFFDEYGIEVLITKLTSAEVSARYQAEGAAGNVLADIVSSSCTDVAFFTETVNQGWATAPADLDAPGLEAVPSAIVADGSTFEYAAMPVAIGYNTDLLSGDDVPQTWEDLIDPKYKGKIVMVDPASSTFYLSWLTWVMDTYGEDFIAALGEQDLGYADAATARNQLGAGQYAIDIPTFEVSMDDTAATGAPVAGIAPDATVANFQCIVTSSEEHAPHPNAAKLYAQFMASPEGAAAMEAGVNGVLSPFREGGIPASVEHVPAAGDQDLILGLLGL